MTKKKKRKKSPSYNDCITVKQAVEYTGLSKSAVHYHLKKGAFPNAIRIGEGTQAICLIPFSEIKDWSPEPQGRPPKPEEPEEQ